MALSSRKRPAALSGREAEFVRSPAFRRCSLLKPPEGGTTNLIGPLIRIPRAARNEMLNRNASFEADRGPPFATSILARRASE